MRSSIYLLLAALYLTACTQPDKKAESSTQLAIADSSKTHPKKAAIEVDKLIIPGKSIGQTALNDNGADVTQRLGRPDAGDAAMGKSLSIWYTDHDTTGYQTMIYTSRQMGTNDETSRVKQIRITSPWFVTKDSVRVGCSLAQITKLYSTKKAAWYAKAAQKFDIYKADGIAFEINPQQKCSAIIVFDDSSQPGSIYLPFYDNLTLYK